MRRTRRPKGPAALRRAAERKLASSPQPPEVADVETARLLHELRVHEMELELQNQELERTSARVESAREHFAMLFDFAPLAYFRLGPTGTIEELNLAGGSLLEVNRASAVGDTFMRFVAVDDRPAFVAFVGELFKKGGGHQTTSVQLVRAGGQHAPVDLTGVRVAGERYLLLAAVDRSDVARVSAMAEERTAAAEAIAGLHALVTRKPADDPTELFEDILDTAVAITGAHGAMLQLREARIDGWTVAASCGLDASFVEHFGTGGPDRACLSGAAWSQRKRVVVEDLTSPPGFLAGSDLDALRAEGVRAAQATPLVARSGTVLGVLSTHFRSPMPAAEQGLEVVDVLARLCADVLEQQRLMSEVRNAEARHRTFLAAVADPVIVVDPAGIIAYANAQADRVFGYLPGELVGQLHSVLLPEQVRGVHEQHLQRFASSPTPRTMAGTPGKPLYARRKDGTEFPIEVTLNPFETSAGLMVSTVVRDISERRRLEAAAERQAERLAGAIETIPDVIAIWDADDHVVACNEAFRRLFSDTPPAGWVGSSVVEVLARSTPFLAARDAVAWFGPEASDKAGVFDVALHDGRRFRVGSRKNSHGGRVTTGIDLTDDLVRERELELARKKAEAASRAKDEFLASMSHELRTPLNAVSGFCQLLQRDRKDHLTDRQREMVDQVAKGGDHLLALIDDVLDLARIEANRVSITVESVSVQDTVTEVIQTLGPAAERAGVELWFDPAGEPGAAVEADPRRFLQILMNLTSNAIKYNNPGGTVMFELSRPSPAVVRVMVTDTGRGIPEEQQDKLFTAFHRAGQEAGTIEGTGIGLVISRRLAELMDGRVGFVSHGGVGSSFWVDLPAHRSAVARPEVVPQVPQAGGSYQGLVVYVDDSLPSLTFLRMLVDQLDGVELLTAGTAAEGIALVRERRPHLVLMDINLPDMSGFEALAVLHADPRTLHIPVVAVSASASAEACARGLQAGFHGYLTKPVRVNELEDVIRDALTRSG